MLFVRILNLFVIYSRGVYEQFSQKKIMFLKTSSQKFILLKMLFKSHFRFFLILHSPCTQISL